MRNAVEEVLKLAVDHPLIASWLALVFLLILLLGVMHVCRIFGGVLILLIREFKHELSDGWDVVKRLRQEITTWKSDP
jgi:hypothetical protein